MKLEIKKLVAVAIGALAIGLSAGAAAQTFVLPTPANNSNASFGLYPDASGNLRQAILMDGIPIAFKYDDFWSYSGKILASIQSVNPSLIPPADFGTYTFSTGTGVILVNLSSVAGGATNPFNLQDPVNLSGGGNGVSGWVCSWGGDPQTCNTWVNPAPPTTLDPARSYTSPASLQGSTSTVGEMLDALHSLNPDYSIPIIYADYNQTGGGDSLFASARVQIINPNGCGIGCATVVADWTLDAINNGVWNQNAPTYNFGEITFTNAANCASIGLWDPLTGEGCAGVTTSGSTYSGDHNKGSGKADFMVFAEDMDLTKYDSSFLFVATVNLGCNADGVNAPLAGADNVQGCNTNGYEEFGIIGGLGPSRRDVPEPSTLALLGLGFAVAGFAIRRRQRA